MRVESSQPCKSGGWYHFDKAAAGTYRPPLPPRKQVAIDAAGLMAKWGRDTTDAQLSALAESLGILTGSLMLLGAAWCPERRAWAFPMRNADGDTIGIRLRNDQGFKWAIDGSRQGIFLPIVSDAQKFAYLPEGPTDTAALLSMGLFAIGRPTCNSGNDLIADALRRLNIFRVVIVADNDDMKRVGNGEARPGIEGAKKLKADLRLASVIWVPPSPFKDAREFLRNGGNRAIIESDIKNRIWSKR